MTRDIDQGRVLAGEFWFTKKEKHFFDRDETYRKGMGWYVNHYPRCMEAAPIVGMDSTQGYLKIGSVAERMFTSYGLSKAPLLRFVVMLRDPVPRLFSNYHHRNVCCNPEKLSFEQWSERQIQQVRTCMANDAGGSGKATSLWPQCGEEGIFAGFYGLQLQVRSRGVRRLSGEANVGTLFKVTLSLGLLTHFPSRVYVPFSLCLQHWAQYFCPSQFTLVSFQSFVDDPSYVMGRILRTVSLFIDFLLALSGAAASV